MKTINLPKSFVYVLLSALLIRTALFISIQILNPSGHGQYDTKFFYLPIANNLIEQGIYSSSLSPPLYPDHHHTPVYPLFISGFLGIGFGVTSIILTQIIFSLLTCLLVMQITMMFTNNKMAATISGFLIAFDIPSIVFSNTLLNETLFTFISVLAIYYLADYFIKGQKITKLMLSGILLGLAILCRPVAFLLPFFLLPLFFMYKRSLKNKLLINSALFLVICFITVSPWIIRNYITFDIPFLATVGNTNLLYFRAAGVIAEKEKTPIYKVQHQLWSKAKKENKNNPFHPIAFSRLERDMAVNIILNNPILYAKNHLISVSYFLSKPLRGLIDFQLGLKTEYSTMTPWGVKPNKTLLSRLLLSTSVFTIVLVVIQIILLIFIWIGFLLGLKHLYKKKNLIPLYLTLSILLYYCIICGGPEANARFRAPIMPYIIIAAGIGISQIRRGLKKV